MEDGLQRKMRKLIQDPPLRQITELPKPEEYPTIAEVEHELALEGYPIND